MNSSHLDTHSYFYPRKEVNRTGPVVLQETQKAAVLMSSLFIYISVNIMMSSDVTEEIWAVDGMSVSPGQIFLISQVGIEDG